MNRKTWDRSLGIFDFRTVLGPVKAKPPSAVLAAACGVRSQP